MSCVYMFVSARATNTIPANMKWIQSIWKYVIWISVFYAVDILLIIFFSSFLIVSCANVSFERLLLYDFSFIFLQFLVKRLKVKSEKHCDQVSLSVCRGHWEDGRFPMSFEKLYTFKHSIEWTKNRKKNHH